MKRLLLGGGGFGTEGRLVLWKQALDAFLGEVESILFIPYALADHDGYVSQMLEKDFNAGRELMGIHEFDDPLEAIKSADCVFAGGGNAFRLLSTMYEQGLIGPLREEVLAGLPYVGVSAGSNLACPTIKTTNDMPIVQPPSLDALGLISFQINPHFISGNLYTRSGEKFYEHRGETREKRLEEFHEMNDTPVLGLWEGSLLRIEGDELSLQGELGARLFRKGGAVTDFSANTRLWTPIPCSTELA